MTATELPTVLGDAEAHRLVLSVLDHARTSIALLHKRLSREVEIDLVIPTSNMFRHYVKLRATLQEWRDLRAWFLGPDCAAYCALLQLDVEKVRESVADYVNLPYNARTFAGALDDSIKMVEDKFGPATEVGANVER